MLEIRDINVNYGPIVALQGVNLAAKPGTVTAVLGANGAGKSTLFKAMAGLVPVKEGTIRMDGADITGLPSHKRARMGISLALEGRRLFHNLSIEENLRVAWEFRPGKEEFREALERAYRNFPILAERRKHAARMLSGGQQQMLILSAAMISGPKYLLLDEPSLGLAPIVVKQIFQFIENVCREQGTAVLLNEQMASLALRVAKYVYVLRRGQIVYEGEGTELFGTDVNQVLSTAYLGGNRVNSSGHRAIW